LVEGGARVDGAPSGDASIPPLHCAASKGDSHVDVLRSLLSAGANPNLEATVKRVTPLHALMRPMDAQARPRFRALHALLDAGADLLLKDQHGQNPLHYACASSVPCSLLEAALLRADPVASGSAADLAGRTMLHLTALNLGADDKTLAVLRLSECEPLQRDAAGQSAMDLCRERFHVRVLLKLERGVVDRAFLALAAAAEPRPPSPFHRAARAGEDPARLARRTRSPVSAFVEADGDHALFVRVRRIMLGR
jgi:ankyrin repeat protein